MLRYPCLVLDHDDTTVDSTHTVNYPQFCEAIARLRPGLTMTEEEYILNCFDPGFYVMCSEILRYTPEEMETHLQMWRDYHIDHHPNFFPGIPQLLQQYKARGGIVCVVSHSHDDIIYAAYDHAGIPRPDLVLGAEQPPEHMKPNPWPLEEIMRQFHLQPKELLMVDDMMHGCTMARKVGVDFAAAAWYGMLPQIEARMKPLSDYFFSTVEEFSRFVLGE